METASGYRLSGRTGRQIRALSCRLGILGRADGSAQWGQDQTVIIAAVHGPVVVGGRREEAEEAVIEVVFKPFSGIPGPQEKHLERLIHKSLASVIQTAMYPRTCIQVVIQAVHVDGSLLAAALNAAIAALLDASIHMRSLLATACVATLPNREEFMDPDAKEEQAADCVTTMAFYIRRVLDDNGLQEAEVGEMVMSSSVGMISEKDHYSVSSACKGCALQVSRLHYNVLEQREVRPS